MMENSKSLVFLVIEKEIKWCLDYILYVLPMQESEQQRVHYSHGETYNMIQYL